MASDKNLPLYHQLSSMNRGFSVTSLSILQNGMGKCVFCCLLGKKTLTKVISDEGLVSKCEPHNR